MAKVLGLFILLVGLTVCHAMKKKGLDTDDVSAANSLKVFMDLMFNMNNWKELAKKFAEDAVLILDQQEIIVGRKNILKYYSNMFDGLGWEQVTTSTPLVGNKHTIWTHGTISLFFASGTEISTHRYMAVYSRKKKEQYEVSMLMTNREEEEEYEYPS